MKKKIVTNALTIINFIFRLLINFFLHCILFIYIYWLQICCLNSRNSYKIFFLNVTRPHLSAFLVCFLQFSFLQTVLLCFFMFFGCCPKLFTANSKRIYMDSDFAVSSSHLHVTYAEGSHTSLMYTQNAILFALGGRNRLNRHSDAWSIHLNMQQMFKVEIFKCLTKVNFQHVEVLVRKDFFNFSDSDVKLRSRKRQTHSDGLLNKVLQKLESIGNPPHADIKVTFAVDDNICSSSASRRRIVSSLDKCINWVMFFVNIHTANLHYVM